MIRLYLVSIESPTHCTPKWHQMSVHRIRGFATHCAVRFFVVVALLSACVETVVVVVVVIAISHSTSSWDGWPVRGMIHGARQPNDKLPGDRHTRAH